MAATRRRGTRRLTEKTFHTICKGGCCACRPGASALDTGLIQHQFARDLRSLASPGPAVIRPPLLVMSRGTGVLAAILSRGRPPIVAEAELALRGFPAGVDGPWVYERVRQVLSEKGGSTTEAEATPKHRLASAFRGAPRTDLVHLRDTLDDCVHPFLASRPEGPAQT